MRAMYHKGDIIIALSTKQANDIVYEIAEAASKAEQAVINHKSLAKAWEKPDIKRLHKNAAARAETRHKALKKLAEDLDSAIKASFK